MGFNQSKLLGTLLLALAQFASATTWYVNGVTGNDSNNCTSPTTACKTIGHAISLASSGDSIMVAPATYMENLNISISLKVIGSAASTTIIDGGGVNTVVNISTTTAHVTLSDLTIRNGHANGGGGIANSGSLSINRSVVTGNSALGFLGYGFGGGIDNFGSLSINSSVITGNFAVPRDIAHHSIAKGGGIYSYGTLTINNSTVSGNVASTTCSLYDGCSVIGGGIYSDSGSTLKINNSTISGNSVRLGCSKSPCNLTATGGGISSGGTLIVASSTLSGNVAYCLPGTTCSLGAGGIDNSGATSIQNSIVANNESYNPWNCGNHSGGTMTSKGYNLSSDNTCNLNGPGDMNNIDPKLGPLQNNGGPTQTEALLAGSPAIDSGNPSGCTDSQGHLLTTDQRGMPRHDKEDTGGCDMGAYESQSD
jgi:hypothetical protein